MLNGLEAFRRWRDEGDREPVEPCFAGRVWARSAVRLCDCEMRAMWWNVR